MHGRGRVRVLYARSIPDIICSLDAGLISQLARHTGQRLTTSWMPLGSASPMVGRLPSLGLAAGSARGRPLLACIYGPLNYSTDARYGLTFHSTPKITGFSLEKSFSAPTYSPTPRNVGR